MKSMDLFNLKQNFMAFPLGFGTLFRGISFCGKNKKIMILSLIPISIAAVLMYFSFTPIYSLINYIFSILVDRQDFSFFGGKYLWWILGLVLKFMSVVLLILVSYIVLQILYIPFCSIVAEKVLKNKGIVEHKNLKQTLAFNFRMMRVGLLKALILTGIAIFFFLSSFFPLLGFLPIYFGFLVLAYDSYDYGLELYGLNFKERRRFFSRGFLLINGHASFLFALSLIPGLILLLLPFSVVGASVTLGELYDAKRKSA